MSEEEQEEQFDLKQSIEKYGQFYPIIKSQYGIVDGFHRKLAGGSEVKEIQVNSRLEHWLLRAHLNATAKTSEQAVEDRKKCYGEIARELKRQDPNLRGRALQRKMAELLGVSERTVRRYLPEEFKETETARGVPVPPPRAKEEPSGAKYSLERKRTALALQKHFPEQAKEIREILRSEKPYLRSKDDIDRYWELVRKSREDPFTVFTKHFYLYDGPTGLGYRPALPYWIKIGLEEVAKEKAKEGGEATSPDALATQVLADYITQQGIERERLVEAAKEHLRKEWLLDVELDS